MNPYSISKSSFVRQFVDLNSNFHRKKILSRLYLYRILTLSPNHLLLQLNSYILVREPSQLNLVVKVNIIINLNLIKGASAYLGGATATMS